MKKIVILIMVWCLCLVNFVFAGQLGQNQNGIFYVEDSGVLAKSKWVALDLDANGKKEYYFFNEAGFLLTNTTTPDGYKVDAMGRWVNNGVVVEEGDEAKLILEGISNVANQINNIPNVVVVRDGTFNSNITGRSIAKKVEKGIERGVDRALNKIDKEITKEYNKNYAGVGEALDYANTVNELENANNVVQAYENGFNDGYDIGETINETDFNYSLLE